MKQLQEAFDAMLPTEEQKERMLCEILIARAGAPARKRRRNNPVRVAALLAAALTLTAVTASAAEALGVSQMIRDYFQQKEEVNVMDTLNLAASGLSVSTDDGWTITITDLFGDENRFLAGVTVEAPEGTVLDRPDYQLVMSTNGTPHTLSPEMLDDPDMTADGQMLLDGYLQGNRWCADQIVDEDPADNRVSFVFDEPLIFYTDGVNVSFTFDHLRWNEPRPTPETRARDTIHVVKEFGVSIPNVSTHFSTNGYHLTPNVTVDAFEGSATLSRFTLTPLSISYELTGDTVKAQLFDVFDFFGSDAYAQMSDEEAEAYLNRFQPTRKERFVKENYPAPVWGWQNVWYKDIPVVVHFKDGTSQEIVFESSGSAEVLAERDPKTHSISVSRTFENVFDLNQIDYLTVCGVRVELPAAS